MHFLESELPVIKPILAIHVPFGSGEPVHKNRPSHGLVFFADGTHRYNFGDGTHIDCAAGDCLYLPQGSSYTVQQLTHTKGAKKTIFAVNFLLSEQAVFAPFRLRVKNPAGMQALFATAEREWVKKGVGCGDAVLAALYAIRAQLKRDWRAAYFSGRQREIIAPALALIERDYDRIAAPALAAACGISEAYLRRLFVRCLGVPPTVYMLQRRLQHAYELIASQEFSVTAAATAAGFCDMSYFSRAFKKHFGIAPAALRRGDN